ncbi:hypothetical protein B1992_05635 [Pseudoxanthomonas broegbernensis]|uniref:Uncharacterized protein n=1 Tax=Pseudoxanthomonas broegbernensis TaxID=83619 RepID=A0A7V8GN32_9GAMM|nr:hypothetical protein [Pseudoxanthomonas broegbernensis]KAF1686874.1 hypothetical protein B1992_05635 [Pseudoxanthomonas broegbernensis]MBB6065535.1 hypothetical protein [Pseudoxanthomonas broegbernensis]
MVTAAPALVLLVPLTWGMQALARLGGFGDNALLQLAPFHTLFNAGGVALFWRWRTARCGSSGCARALSAMRRLNRPMPPPRSPSNCATWAT